MAVIFDRLRFHTHSIFLLTCVGCRQLPPATGQAPWIRIGWVRDSFDFRVLRQNRRVVKGESSDTADRTEEIENFHGVLMDVSMGIASERVRKFIVQAYVRGTLICGTADHAELEGNTSVFTKRRQELRPGVAVGNRRHGRA